MPPIRLSTRPFCRLTERDVFRVIGNVGQQPRWAYVAGMTRLSCSFCILASRQDLRHATQLRPTLYRQYADLERRIDHALSPTRIALPEITGIPVPSDQATRFPKSTASQTSRSLEAGR